MDNKKQETLSDKEKELVAKKVYAICSLFNKYTNLNLGVIYTGLVLSLRYLHFTGDKVIHESFDKDKDRIIEELSKINSIIKAGEDLKMSEEEKAAFNKFETIYK